jgi:hypothetical protein
MMRLFFPLALITFALVPAAAQISPTLKELTVPAGSLPAGCGLKPLSPGGGFVRMKTNPSISTDRTDIGVLSGFVDSGKQLASIPKGLLDDSESRARYLKDQRDPKLMARFIETQAEGIGAAYVAIYREPGAPEIGVYALQFSRAISASERERMSKDGVVIFGSMAVMLWGDGDSRKCFEAVKRHVLAVKARSYSVESPSK